MKYCKSKTKSYSIIEQLATLSLLKLPQPTALQEQGKKSPLDILITAHTSTIERQLFYTLLA